MEGPDRQEQSCLSSHTCTSFLLGCLASVLVVGGIFLAFHKWDYLWLVVSGVGVILVFIAAAVFMCSPGVSHRSPKRGASATSARQDDFLGSGSQLANTFSVSQMSLNMLPPYFPACDQVSLISGRAPNASTQNHIMNINGQNYLLLPIVGDAVQDTSLLEGDARRFSSVLTTSQLQAQISAKRTSDLQTYLVATRATPETSAAQQTSPPKPVQRVDDQETTGSNASEDTDSGVEATSSLRSVSVDATSSSTREAATTSCDIADPGPTLQSNHPPEPSSTQNPSGSSTEGSSARPSGAEGGSATVSGDNPSITNVVNVSDEVPLIVIDAEPSSSCDPQAGPSGPRPRESLCDNDTDLLLPDGTDAAQMSDSEDNALTSTPPPSYDEVTNDMAVGAYGVGYGTI